MISPKKVKFNNYSSVDFPTFTLLTCLSFDNTTGESNTFLTRGAVASESVDGRFKNTSHYKYTENLTLKITFIKEGYGDFSLDEARKVLAWLTSKDTPSFLDVYDDIYSEVILYSVLGGFTNIQSYKLGSGRVVGFVADFESISPFAYSPINTFKRTITAPTTFTITCDNDDTAYVYPRITVKHKDTSVIITNTIIRPKTDLLTGVTENNIQVFTTAVRNSGVDETVIIDGANKLIYSETNPNRIFGTDFGTNDIRDQWVWLPLADGENTLAVTGNCDLTLEWREVRKIGEW